MGSSIDVASTGQLVNKLMNPPNPMEQFGQTVNALSNFRQFQANQAAAQAYRNAVDPVTGQFDQGKFLSEASQGPAAYNFGDLMRSAGTGFEATGRGQQQDLDTKLSQMSAIQGYMGPLYNRIQHNQPVTGQDVLDAMNTAPPGLVTPQLRGMITQQVQSVGGPTGDASGIVLGGYYANQHAMDILKSRFPNYGAITTGGTIYPTQTNPTYPGRPGEAGGVQYPTQGLPTTPSGTEMVTLTVGTQTIPNVPANVANAITQNPSLLQSFYPTQAQQMQPGDRISVSGAGGGGSAPGHYPTPTAAGGGGGGAPVPQPPASPERISVPSAATAPLWRQPPGPLPAEAGGVGLTPQQGYQTNIVEPSQKAATALSTGAGQTSDINALIDDMRSQVNQPGWNSGLGAQAGSTWRQVLQRLGVNANPGAAPAQIDSAEAAQNEFAKDANLIASRQLAAIGNPSDARQGLAEAITPGLAQSKEGVLGITATLKGNQDALNRTNTAWAQAKANGWTDGRHLEWLNNNWKATDPATGGRFDPRVFWLADTAGNANDQWRRFASKIPQDQQPQFLKNVQFAKNQGWIKQNDDQSFAVVSP